MWKRVEIRNFKGLSFVDLELAGCTVLVGANSTGKTTVLQACELLGLLAAPLEDRHVPLSVIDTVFADVSRFDAARLRTHGCDPAAAIALRATVERDNEAEWQFGIQVVPAEASDGSYSQQVALLYKGLELLVSPRAEDANVQQVALASVRELSASKCGPAFRVALSAPALAAPSIPTARGSGLLRNGRGLPSMLADMAATDRPRIQQVEAALQRVIPRVRGIRTPLTTVMRSEEEEVVIGGSAQIHVLNREHSGHRLELKIDGIGWLDASLVSDGTLIALGILALVHSPSCPRLLLIDDLDHSLHPSAHAALVAILRNVVEENRVQLICTTHAPYMLDSFAADEVRVLAVDSRGFTHASKLSEHSAFKSSEGALSTGEFWSTLEDGWVVDPGTTA